MTRYLLLVTLGPVQGFIAQARRTRDLWYGSHVLSELSRAAARALVKQDAQLVFPALAPGDSELERCDQPLRPNGDPPQAIPNKLLALTPEGSDPAAIARVVREETKAFWRTAIADRVRQRCRRLISDGIDDVWNEQIETFLEFTAAWAPADNFVEARRKVSQAVDGRKLLRDFRAWEWQRGDVPSSSLDGARKTVLRKREDRDKDLAARYRIGDGENLDAVGLIKRAGGDPDQFVPIVNVAVADWVAYAEEIARDELTNLIHAAREIEHKTEDGASSPNAVKRGLSRVVRDLPCVKPFQFDASIFFPDRWPSVFKEQGLARDPLEWGERYVLPVLKKAKVPFPYVAFLVADGDRVGQALDTLTSPDSLRAFSKTLAEFASAARQIVEVDHRGALIYSGSDDVLAIVPVTRAVACADALRTRFAAAMAETSLPDGLKPTLSVGIGIGHVMEGMGDLLNLAREAEGAAKTDRNALAVIVDRRSGDKRTWRSSWDGDPVRQLHQSTELFRKGLSSGKVYEIGAILRRLPAKVGPSEDQSWAALLVGEVRRALARTGESAFTPSDVDLAFPGEYAKDREAVERWVNRMLLARVLEMARPGAERVQEDQ
ncbi:MAG: type III-B CRISPR-associated protein Cas10/Cmr2 [Dehalococcoidia bacterium]|nr:MAG: type III-B CRISPR-associated protein Cas10/Cmr2 [Dehalococcoidia bacterium]